MADKVRVKLFMDGRDGKAGEEVDVTPGRAQQLLAGGVAVEVDASESEAKKQSGRQSQVGAPAAPGASGGGGA